ncbi:hypothetical protein Tco_1041517 [Tanacetum coccineum]|uniref:Uncharacterized protein n=1 Tax=Tanacetum coccineum TaxID=301880 RepID=A0ABQ5GGC7_9ASTR
MLFQVLEVEMVCNPPWRYLSGPRLSSPQANGYVWLVQEGTALGKDIIKSVDGCNGLPKFIRDLSLAMFHLWWLLHVAVKEYAFGFKVLLFNPLIVATSRYVVPTGKDNVIVSAGRTKVIPAGSCMIKSLKLPKSGNQLRFLIQRVPSGRTSNALSIPRRFSALMFSSLIASKLGFKDLYVFWVKDGNEFTIITLREFLTNELSHVQLFSDQGLLKTFLISETSTLCAIRIVSQNFKERTLLLLIRGLVWYSSVHKA